MHTYDLVMIVILVGAAVHGLIRGMAWQLAPIAALVLGYFVARPVAPHIAHWFGSSAPANELLAMLVLYLAVSAGVFLLARMLRGIISRLKIEDYDRHLGLLLGGVKGLLFCLLVTFFLVAFSAPAREAIMPTQSGKFAALIMDRLHPFMPESFHDAFAEHIHALDERLDGENYHERLGEVSTANSSDQTTPSGESLVDQAMRILNNVKK